MSVMQVLYINKINLFSKVFHTYLVCFANIVWYNIPKKFSQLYLIYFRFPVAVLSDGNWHRVAVSVSTGRFALYVDCSMVESVDWAYKEGLQITTDGLIMVGGIIEGFETPFEVQT